MSEELCYKEMSRVSIIAIVDRFQQVRSGFPTILDGILDQVASPWKSLIDGYEEVPTVPVAVDPGLASMLSSAL